VVAVFLFLGCSLFPTTPKPTPSWQTPIAHNTNPPSQLNFLTAYPSRCEAHDPRSPLKKKKNLQRTLQAVPPRARDSPQSPLDPGVVSYWCAWQVIKKERKSNENKKKSRDPPGRELRCTSAACAAWDCFSLSAWVFSKLKKLSKERVKNKREKVKKHKPKKGTGRVSIVHRANFYSWFLSGLRHAPCPSTEPFFPIWFTRSPPLLHSFPATFDRV
jgi:hypothetical protein